MTDEDFMQKAIDPGRRNPHHPFGAIIVDRRLDDVIAEGVNQAAGNPLFHGEVVAINDAVERFPDVNWSSLTLFTTAEPCPMCMSAILWCGFDSVVFGTSIPTLTNLGWNQIRIRSREVVQRSHRPQTSVVAGVLESECDNLFCMARTAK